MRTVAKCNFHRFDIINLGFWGDVNRTELPPRNNKEEAYLPFCYDSDIRLPEYVIKMNIVIQHLSQVGQTLALLQYLICCLLN